MKLRSPLVQDQFLVEKSFTIEKKKHHTHTHTHIKRTKVDMKKSCQHSRPSQFELVNNFIIIIHYPPSLFVLKCQ